MIETAPERERYVMAAAVSGDDEEAETNLRELALLIETGGNEAAAEMVQKREAAHPGHYLGKGKLEELRILIEETGADAVVTDDELTASQRAAMEKVLGVTVLDRTLIILDIFAKRASTAEGKAQVELAQYRHRLSHLTGLGVSLSRLGGGIGTRGPGESKLETDRRHIRARIAQLNGELKDIASRRALLRENRNRTGLPVISMVGYTNAGKSTLMNSLTGAGVLAEDKLFATLDTTTRAVSLPGGGEALCTDTVGFIRKLPHHLIQAFRATLDELRYSDILLHVVDAANPDRENQMKVVYETLDILGCKGKPVITAFNKTDLPVSFPLPPDPAARARVNVSALTGENNDVLLGQIEKILQGLRKKNTLLIPYAEGRWVELVHDRCEILNEEHTAEGTVIEAYLDDELAGRLKEYVMEG
ncbi:MAG: GTPase HflX [Clostridiales bacterium]|jgi:GTP-binding protein HflX|nr:GTPase HflX [Clostridiales bacterium]